jgi:hypothetical protein
VLETNLLPGKLIKNYYINSNEEENDDDVRIIAAD